MKRGYDVVIGIFLGVLVMLIMFGIPLDKWPAPSQKPDQLVQQRQADVNKMLGRVAYMQDSRTGICFAYYVNAQPILATVPCDAIPSHLLVTYEEKTK